MSKKIKDVLEQAAEWLELNYKALLSIGLEIISIIIWVLFFCFWGTDKYTLFDLETATFAIGGIITSIASVAINPTRKYQVGGVIKNSEPIEPPLPGELVISLSLFDCDQKEQSDWEICYLIATRNSKDNDKKG